LHHCSRFDHPPLLAGAATRRANDQAAAFPEPAEELFGASAGGKMYVFYGLAPG
jgi:hypothetical protein